MVVDAERVRFVGGRLTSKGLHTVSGPCGAVTIVTHRNVLFESTRSRNVKLRIVQPRLGLSVNVAMETANHGVSVVHSVLVCFVGGRSH